MYWFSWFEKSCLFLRVQIRLRLPPLPAAGYDARCLLALRAEVWRVH
jgi:hypothetical protein